MRVVLYQSTDKGEVDYKYLAVAFDRKQIVDHAAGVTEDAARARLETKGRPLDPELDMALRDQATGLAPAHHATDPELDAALLEDAAKLVALDADPGPTLDDVPQGADDLV